MYSAMSVNWILVLATAAFVWDALAKKCYDVNVSNDVSQFEKELRNCTVVVGNLKILLIETGNATDYKSISFPELTEITGYLMMYRIYGLTSVGQLFPNLTIIRGYSLFMDYALILYDLRDLKEIGLYGLRRIARGSTRIEKCTYVCNVLSIDWGKIGGQYHETHYFERNDNDCEDCPDKCKGFCWNQKHCQKIESDHCHSECVGCTSRNNPKACIACSSYNDNGKCVSNCPKNKIRHALLACCIAKKDCHNSTLYDTWWVFKGECINECPLHYIQSHGKLSCDYCGDNCPKLCEGKQVDSISSAESLRGCTHINGSLLIRVDSQNLVDELNTNLGMIKEIDGYLKIYRSATLTSLEFLKNLRVVHGYELVNGRYALFVNENKKLHKLWNWNEFSLTIMNGGFSFHYNSQLCLAEIEQLSKSMKMNYTPTDVSPFSNGNKRACNYIDLNISTIELTATNITIAWSNFTNNVNASLVGYVVYYAQDPFANISVYDEFDECTKNKWESVFVSNHTYQILNLNPYTLYAYYVKTYTTSQLHGGQTRIARFTTLIDDPSEPTHFEAISLTSDSVSLSWIPPAFQNGVLNYYELVVYFEMDDEEFLFQRDYCEHPHRTVDEEIEVTLPPLEIPPNLTSCCANKKQPDLEPFDISCASLDMVTLSKSPKCKDYMYILEGNKSSLMTFPSGSHNIVKRSFPPILETKINSSTTSSYEVKGLNHFSMYIFVLRACNSENFCSGSVMTHERTLKDEDADNILGLAVTVDSFNLIIKWLEHKAPNAFIVSYHVEHRRTDLQHSKTSTECMTRKEFLVAGSEFQIKNFLSGQYSLRAKAVSLSGPGKFSQYTEFKINQPYSSTTFYIGLVVIILICMIIGGTYFYHYKHKMRVNLDRQRLISNRSSDYCGPIYVEDDWEMGRDSVEVAQEIGQGSFGMVYSGLIKTHNLPCAIKTINAQANLHEKLVFLNEASVMKSFSEAHHVVKLLGVVSRGQPPLVVMELMARGDLKTLLRQARSSSAAITCNEMYRMAAEIADGMMYLAAKKFVHRDLAARNCLVAADHTVKVGDFGMARDVYSMDYYRKESGGLMPIRWMSPESLADGVFTTDSDAWSYGVLLWEMVTLAELPYQGLANEQVLQFVVGKGTLERPLDCPDVLYEIMEACWMWRPSHRPLFKDIVEKLEAHIGQHFKLVSFYHSAEGEDYRMNAKERLYNAPALAIPFSRDTAVYWNALEDDVSI